MRVGCTKIMCDELPPRLFFFNRALSLSIMKEKGVINLSD